MESVHHIVITTTAIVLIRWPGAEWRDLQDHFDDYVTSFGPLDADDAMDLIAAEWPDIAKLKAEAIHQFFREDAARLVISGSA